MLKMCYSKTLKLGGPLLPTLTWVFLRYFLKNEGCWEEIENEYVWWPIKGTVLITICVSFNMYIRGLITFLLLLTIIISRFLNVLI